MKSNLRITAAAKFICLVLAFSVCVSGCGSAGTGDTSLVAGTEMESASGDTENVSVEKESVDIVGSSSETEETTETSTESESSTEETVVPEITEPELTEEEKLWQDRLVADVKNTLNVRAEANENGKIVGKMEKGAYATIIEKGAQWTKIKSGKVEGYVSNEYCLFGMDAKAMAEQLCETVATIKTNGLRIRKEMNTDSKVLAKVNKGEKLVVDVDAETADGWVAVKYNDSVGYVSANYVTVDVVMETALTIEEIREKARIEAEKKKAEEAAKKKAEQEAALAKASDLDLLAALIWCEAGAEPYEAQLAVGACVVNRMEHRLYPNTIKGVIYQKNQFTPAGSGKVERVLQQKKASASCYKAAAAALAGEDNTNGCRSFRLASTGRAGIVYGKIVFFSNN